jgi:hypothetical protein
MDLASVGSMFEAETHPSSQGILALADLRKPTARIKEAEQYD